MAESSYFITHDGNGVFQWNFHGTSKKLGNSVAFTAAGGDTVQSKPTDIFVSENGNYFALATKESLRIYAQNPKNGSIEVKHILELPVPDARQVNFSPKGNFVAVNAPMYTVNDCNLKMFDMKTGKLLLETNDRRKDSFRWDANEEFAYRMIGSEICFYEDNQFFKVNKKLQLKVTGYSIAVNKTNSCTYVATFTKGQPSIVKIFSYPHFNNVISSQSLFKCDSVELKWNAKGDALLIMAMKDVDTTGESYYGETAAHFLDLRGNAYMVLGKKKGSVHCCEWLPSSDAYIVCAGVIPPHVTMYNLKGDAIFDFGEASVNGIYLNPFGNLLALGGFGNMSGDVFIWNMKTKTKISSFNAADTTHFAWTADGQHIVTSTHHARLKVANGFKIWDFLGNLIHTEGCSESVTTPLYKTLVVPAPGLHKEPTIASTVRGKFIVESRAAGKYIPPFLRTAKQQEEMAKRLEKMKVTSNAPPNVMMSASEKKIRDLEKKLKAIQQLKKQQAEGKQLEKNQLEKITKENDLQQELNQLKAAN